ncbi:hypothetical protein [Pontibacter sp. SGAir0037]|uniref:hypothetical protein n=1 Tax=Pontibacter sp. SGAir0037 TaxID=2571030 RepID=UPI00143CFEDB|nr:hypothetical protein [Pontibacter sp. SGAir0037]
MTKGHNQDRNEQRNPQPENRHDSGQNRSLSDQQKDKSPNQGRNSNPEQSGGTKGQNAI